MNPTGSFVFLKGSLAPRLTSENDAQKLPDRVCLTGGQTP
jgi:hypothetical protein